MKPKQHQHKHDEKEGVQPAEETPVAGAVAAAETPAGGEDTEALRRQVAEQLQTIDQLRRALADMDNRRKRAERVSDENIQYAVQSFATELLPVMDNLQRALKHAEETRDFEALLKGFQLLRDQMVGAFKRHHVKRIEALGLPFDPHHHEAIAEIESAEHAPHTVIEVSQDGYTLHDRTIRPSRVVVSRGPAEPAKEEDKPENPPAGGSPETEKKE
jgi:molecular chaperone GrpE